jgi:hypothetical protein
MPKIRVALVLIIMAGAVSVASTAASPASGPHEHSLVLTSTKSGLDISSLMMFVRPTADGRLRGHVHLTVTNHASSTVRRALELASCTRGARGNLNCPPVARRTVVLRPGQTASYVLVGVMRRPPASLGAVQATLSQTGPGAQGGHASDADLLLGSRAWTGSTSGLHYGITSTPTAGFAVAQAKWDLPALSADVVHMHVKWSGIATSAVTTTLERCAQNKCTPTGLHPDRARSGPTTFDQRIVTARDGADRAQLHINAPNGATLLAAMMPWPQ